MTETEEKWIRKQPRFKGIFNEQEQGFRKTVPLTSFGKCKESREYVNQALEEGCDGTQTGLFEEQLAKYVGFKYAVSLNSGESAMRLALRLAAEKLYGSAAGILTPKGMGSGGSLCGKRVFCPDLITADMVNPVVFEGGEPVFIDSSEQNWSMNPEVLSAAFLKYPDTRIVIVNHVYGFPGSMMEIRKICFEHEALLIECIGEAIGASYRIEALEKEDGKEVWAKAGSLGDYAVADFTEDKLLGPSGGALLLRSYYEASKAGYWASGAKASTPWNQHEELGHICGMSDLDAAMLRGQMLHLDETIAKKRNIYERYRDRLDGDLAYMIPVEEGTRPNYWITALTCESSIQFKETRSDRNYTYGDVHGSAAPMEIYDVLLAFHAKGLPVQKPMSMQPVYCNYEHFIIDGPWRMYEDFVNDTFWLRCDRARQYYESGICLPSDADMTKEEQDKIIDLVLACFDKADLDRMVWKLMAV